MRVLLPTLNAPLHGVLEEVTWIGHRQRVKCCQQLSHVLGILQPTTHVEPEEPASAWTKARVAATVRHEERTGQLFCVGDGYVHTLALPLSHVLLKQTPLTEPGVVLYTPHAPAHGEVTVFASPDV